MRDQDSPETAASRAKFEVRRPALAIAAHDPLAAGAALGHPVLRMLKGRWQRAERV